MRPIRLSIKGLNSFAEEQLIDFEQLTSRGLFGIFGPTGSGKTSILDGITLSLYGDIARTTKEFINANMDMAVVSFEFEIAGNTRHRYRVERAFKGSKAGGVTTKHARIIEIDGDQEIVVEDRPTKVNEACEAIIGLTREDFTRTVVLPQGKFSDFLKLKNKDRGEMLERLFNLQAYGDELTAKLQRRAKQVRLRETEMSGELKAYADVTPEAIAEQTAALEAEAKLLEAAKVKSLEADQAAAQAQGIWQLQQEKQQVSARLDQHMGKQAAVLEQEKQINLAETARQLMPQVLEWERLAKSHENLKQQQTELLEKLTQQRERHADCKSQYEALQQEREENLPKQQARHMQLEQALTDKTVLDTNKARLDLDQRQLKAMTEQLEALQQEAMKTAEQLGQVNAAILQTEASLAPLRQPESYRTALSALHGQLQQQESSVSQLDKLKAKRGELKGLAEQSQTALTALQQAVQLTQKELEAQQLAVETLKSSLPSGEQMAAQAAAIEQLKGLWAQYERFTDQMKAIEGEMAQSKAQLEGLESTIQTATARAAELSAQVTQMGIEAQARQLRNLLTDGKACPVCGSMTHPLGHQISLDLGLDTDQTADQLKAAEMVLRDLEKRQIELVTQIKHLAEQQTQNQQSRAALGEAFLTQPLADAVAGYQAQVAAAESGQRQLEALNGHVLIVSERLNGEKRQVASCEAAFKGHQQQLDGLETEIEQLEKSVTAQTAALSAGQAEIKVMDILEAYEAMKAKAEQSETLEEQLRGLRQQLAALQTEEQRSRQQLQGVMEAHVQLKTQCQVATESLAEKTAQLEAVFGDLYQLAVQLSQLQAAMTGAQKKYEAAKIGFETSAETLKRMEETYQGLVQQCQLQGDNRAQAEQVLRAQLKETTFDTPKAVKAQYMELDALEQLKMAVKAFYEEVQRLNGALSQLTQQLNGRSISEGDYMAFIEAKKEALVELTNRSETCTALKTGLEALKRRYEQMKDLIEAKAKIDLELAQVVDLEKLFQGKRFVAYMAAHRLKYISGKASEQLFDISLGNYGIETDDEGNFAIRDYKNGGVLRDPSSLSGGETFMVSLALALALSAQIQLKGTAPLEFFFLDEGFGTLDEDTLEVVLSALERLHHERLSIGLISHVESIKNRVPIKLIVSPAQSGLGGSRVKIELS